MNEGNVMREYRKDGGTSFKPVLILCLLLALSGCQSSGTGGNMSFNSGRSDQSSLLNIVPDQSIKTTSIGGSNAKAILNPFIGKSAHICGPSGFGRRSHCFFRVYI